MTDWLGWLVESFLRVILVAALVCGLTVGAVTYVVTVAVLAASEKSHGKC